jgi:hypothetical protein
MHVHQNTHAKKNSWRGRDGLTWWRFFRSADEEARREEEECEGAVLTRRVR